MAKRWLLRVLEDHAMRSSAGKHLLHYLSYELSQVVFFPHGIEKQNVVATVMLLFQTWLFGRHFLRIECH